MYNVVNLIGRLGQDPEVKNLKGGKTVVNVSMVTSDSYKTKDGEQREDSEWHSLVSWGKSADFPALGRVIFPAKQVDERSEEKLVSV